MSEELQGFLKEAVQDGQQRLQRSWPSLLATGFVGGVDVTVGIFAMLLVRTHNGSELLGALAFGIGFIALVMAGSELFTENFLVPVTTVVAGAATKRDLGRLWLGTLSLNLVGGLVMVLLIVYAFPELHAEAVRAGGRFIERGLGLQSMLSAVLAGIVITLMTWMQRRATMGAKLVAAVAAAFVLNYGELGHVVVASLEIFAGMLSGAAYGIADWLPLFVVMVLGNMVGGVGLVTVTRLVQVGRERVAEEREVTARGERESAGDVPLDADG